MARSLYEVLTTPPPIKPPPPKYPLFTKKFHSTTSFSPGHVFGLAALGLGLYGLTKFAIERAQADSVRVRREASRFPQPPLQVSPPVPGKADTEPKVAQAENQRGQYGPPGARP